MLINNKEINAVEEYKLLREEMLSLVNIRFTTINILYTGVSAILALGISLANPLIFLLSFCVIIPTYYMVMDNNKSIKKIGAYLQVFHENFEFNWESRLFEFEKNINGSTRTPAYSFMFPFYILGFIAIGLFFLYFDFSVQVKDARLVELMVAFVLFGLTLLFTIKHNQVKKIKGHFVLEWERIKNRKT